MRKLSQSGLVLGVLAAGMSSLAAQPVTPPARGGPGMMMQDDRGQGPMQPPAGPAPMHMMMGGDSAAMGYAMHETLLRLMVVLIDADGDGAFSLAELSAVQERIFHEVDIDRNDRVTPEEVTAFWHGAPIGP